MSVIDIIKIEEVDHVYILKFRLVLEWYLILLNLTNNRACYDRYDYRIKYLNLKNTRSQNSLALEDVQRLWIPFLVFDNTEKNEATKVQSNFLNRTPFPVFRTQKENIWQSTRATST